MLGVQRQTVAAWVRARRFPAPIDVGINKLLWPVEDVEAALARRRPATECGRRRGR
jgi:predicted DNA-binding transcriptional regulator AlpA